jgi:ABC-type phosphate transport system substrate-binding protein
MNKVIIGIILTFIVVFTVSADTLYVIGHKGSFSQKLTKESFADYYLLKIKYNEVGQKIIPINLPINHPARQQFSRIIFNRSPYALNEYWDRMSFRGIRPPVVQNSEHAVLLFVSRIKGAIGYVSQKPTVDSVDVLGEISL